MQTQQEDTVAYEKAVWRTCFYSNLIFLICHISYLIFFFGTGIYLLGYINIGSAVLYALMFLFIKYKRYDIYAVLTGAEITAFMSFATAVCGFQAGFHLCLIGLCILAYYSGYFSIYKSNIIKPQYWCILMFVIYVFLFFYCLYNPPVFELTIFQKSFLFVSHAIIVFGFITIFLYTFVRYVVKLEKRIMLESRTDKLTQVANRYGLMDYINAINNKSAYYLSIFDIDDFKVVNDKYGHICGDEILKDVAQFAKNTFEDDFVARYGGEEFIIILKMNDDINDSYKKIEEFRKKIEEHEFKFENNIIHLTITIGVAKYEIGMSVDDWIMKADKNLYAGKTSGKNKVVM